MAIKIEIDATIEELMIKLGCSTDLTQAALGAALAVSYTIEGVEVHTTDLSPLKPAAEGLKLLGGHKQLAPIKMGVLESILSGKLPAGAAKNLAKIGLEKAVKQVLLATTIEVKSPFAQTSAHVQEVVHQMEEQTGKPVKSIEPSDLKKIFGKPSHDDIKADEMITALEAMKKGIEGSHKIPNGAVVKLSQATKLYQAVQGSDTGSVYFAVAISPALKVAVRVKSPSKVSIRVEGVGISAVKNQLVQAGLSGSETHYSVHLQCTGETLARKAIGAVLFAIGAPFAMVASDLSPIWGKGA